MDTSVAAAAKDEAVEWRGMMKTETELLSFMEDMINCGPYKPNWDSLMQVKIPEWFRRERLGIFLHWGVYSVPAYSNEWYSRNMYIKGMPAYEHHIKTYGNQKEFGYKDFIPMFTAEKFEPREWMELFAAAGAGYVFAVAEHHDGFQMYESALSRWNAKEMGPKCDVMQELKDAAEKREIQFCASSHRAEHWFFMGHGREFDSDVKEPMKKGDFYWPAMQEPKPEELRSLPYPSEEFLLDWLARTVELIEKYQPRLLYFDWWILHEAFKPYLKKLAAFYYNYGVMRGEEVCICYKYDAMMFGSGIVEMERGGFAQAKPYPWQMDTAVARNSWCYTESLSYKSSYEIICTLLDVVSKNGNLLLNIGPKADGTIPEGDFFILRDLASWMAVNRQAIHGARVWRKSEEGPTKVPEGAFTEEKETAYTEEDYRFTINHGAIYAACLKPSVKGRFLVRALAENSVQNPPDSEHNSSGFHGTIENVTILGYDGAIEWRLDTDGLHVRAKVPEKLATGFPIVLKICC